MNILAMDTSTDVGSVAVLRDGRLAAQHLLRAPMNLLGWLSPAIRKVLEEAALDLNGIDAIAAGVGPGSFTGVRLQLATARTLAQVRGIPLYGISSLEALAFQALPHHGMILSCVDARRGELFAGIFSADGAVLKREEDYAALSPEAVVEKTKKYGGSWIVVGEMNPYKTFLLERIPGSREASFLAGMLQASSIGALAAVKPAAEPGDAYAVHPLYIRASQAEIEKNRVKT